MPIKTKGYDRKTKPRAVFGAIGLAVYLLIIATFSLMLLTEPEGFEITQGIPLLLVALFISGLGLGYWIAADAKSANIAVLGVISLAILFTFVGFFIIAALGWSIAVSRA